MKMPKTGIARNLYVGETDRQAEERGKFGSKGFYESLVYLWRKYNATAMSLEEVLRASEASLIAGTPDTVRAKSRSNWIKARPTTLLPGLLTATLPTRKASARSSCSGTR